jgi:hypothetical protein
MSSAIMLKQRDSIHLAVDAAAYFSDGIVASLIDKCAAIHEMHCAITTLGASNWQPIICDAIREKFATFDELMDGIEVLLKEVFEAHSDTVAAPGLRVTGDVWMIGWSKRRQAPEGFTIGLDHLDEWIERRAKGDLAARQPFKIDLIGNMGLDLNWHPHPTGEQLFAARFPVPLNETDSLHPEVDLLRLMEVHRRMPFDKVAGAYCVGGYALLTSVDSRGVTQRRIHEWPEDRVGELITPQPIDWCKWRAEHDPAHVSAQIIPISSPPLNRHQRRQLKANAGRC